MTPFPYGTKVRWKSGSRTLSGTVLAHVAAGQTLREAAGSYFRAYRLTPINRYLRANVTRDHESVLVSVTCGGSWGKCELHWPPLKRLEKDE